MPNRVFLDIGAYQGETVEAVLGMDFDSIYSFEPMPAQFAELHRRFGETPGVELFNYGLSDATGQCPVYGANEHFEASVYQGAAIVDSTTVTTCEFVRASDWFEAFIEPDDYLAVKINCEGSEVDILDDLITTGEIWKIDAVTICFDIANVPGQEHREAATRAALDAIGFKIPRWHLFGAARGLTHQARLQDWLDSTS